MTGLAELVRADFAAFVAIDPERGASLRRTFDVLTAHGFWAVVLYRVGNVCYRTGVLRPLARLLLLAQVALFASELHPRMEAGPGLVVPHPQGVATGAGVVLGARVQLFKGVSIGTAGYRDRSRDGFPTVGDDCRIFDGAKLFGPITIGTGCTVGTAVVLTTSLPPRTVVLLEQAVVRRTVDDPAEVV